MFMPRGLLSPEERQYAMFQGLLNAGPMLMAAGAPSTNPGGNMGLLGGLGQAFSQPQQQMVQNKFQGLQMEDYMRQREQEEARAGLLAQATEGLDPELAAWAQAYPEEYAQRYLESTFGGSDPVTANQVDFYNTPDGPRLMTHSEALQIGATPYEEPERYSTSGMGVGSDFGLTGEYANAPVEVERNPDGSVKNLSFPTLGGVSVEVGGGPEFGTIPQGYMLRQDEEGNYQMVPVPGAPLEQTLTPAQEAIDSAVATEYVTWTMGGGADAQKNLEQMQDALQTLRSDSNVSGPDIALQPDGMLAVTNPEALNTREQVEEVVQRNLRQVLGAQFAEEEGKRLIARAYNPALEEEVNAERIDRLVRAMDAAYRAKQKLFAYYQQHGTLAGYDGITDLNMQDFYDAIEGEGRLVSGAPAGGGNGWGELQVSD